MSNGQAEHTRTLPFNARSQIPKSICVESCSAVEVDIALREQEPEIMYVDVVTSAEMRAGPVPYRSNGMRAYNHVVHATHKLHVYV